MNTNVKIAAIGLAAALVGGSAGATLTSWKSEPLVAQTQPAPAVAPSAPQVAAAPTTLTTTEPLAANADASDDVQPSAAPVESASAAPARRAATVAAPAPTAEAAPAKTAAGSGASSTRQVNYDYGKPRASSAPSAYTYRNEPTFWNKHRDKLTVGAGALGGAVLGALIGGKRGAGIGALAGAGGSAYYTYKGRNRAPSY